MKQKRILGPLMTSQRTATWQATRNHSREIDPCIIHAIVPLALMSFCWKEFVYILINKIEYTR